MWFFLYMLRRSGNPDERRLGRYIEIIMILMLILLLALSFVFEWWA